MTNCISLKNIQIISAMQSIGEMLQLEDLSTKVNYNLNKNLITFENALKTYNKCNKELLDKYAIKNEDGSFKIDEETNNIKFAPNNKKEYITKHDELLNYDENVTILNIKLSSLPDNIGKGAKLYNLMFMIEDDTE